MTRPTDEDRITGWLRSRTPGGSRVLVGIGDDAAVVRSSSGHTLLTTDMLVEGVDFRRDWTTPRALGRKSVAVNVSDLAAMGARPLFFTVALGLPAGLPPRWVRELHRGLTDARSARGAVLVGGDLSRSEAGVVISITAVGEPAGRRVLCRSGGRTGDLLYVTGVLGRSAAGLALLRAGRLRGRSAAEREALRAHRLPEARCEEGAYLAAGGFARAAMDLSDGLSTDLPRLCAASGVDAEIDPDLLPLFPAARRWGCDPLALALDGGEDFELLFAVPKAKAARLERLWPAPFAPITRIGRLVPGRGKVWLAGAGSRRPLPKGGFDHFRG
ncbi:MAG: thiamine-phosphate kinase [Acidobacteria bacterium]|nr:thiamine-phosphate kinase [Acidobacteriota bacterium]